MKQAMRCVTVLALSALVAGQSFAPFYESDQAQQHCLVTHLHHLDWMQSDAPRMADTGAPGSHSDRSCCHLQSYLVAAALAPGPVPPADLIPAGEVRPVSPRRIADNITSVIVPPG